MKYTLLAVIMIGLAACQSPTSSTTGSQTDTCNADVLQVLVGGPSSATSGLDVPASSRHYGSQETIDPRIVPSRLNFVHSGTAIESVTDPKSTVKRVFCG